MRLQPILALAFTLIIGPTVQQARAQQPPGDEQEESDQRARDLFLEGEAHYAAGRYEQAAENYLQAYELSKRPALLFNVGNAYERLGEYDEAAEYLRRYIESPRARDVVSVRERIRRLEAAAEQARREQERREQERPAPGEREPRVQVAAQPSSRADDRQSPAMWWLIGSGAAAATTVVFGLLARDAGNSAAAGCAETSTGRALCRDQVSSDLTRETVFAIGADVSAIAALTMAGVGLYLLLEDDAPQETAARSARLTPDLVPGGFGVSISGRF